MTDQQASDRVHLRAPAKVNLILRVLDRRPDGFHNLWSLMQAVALEDELELRRRRDSQETRLFCPDASVPTDHRNLVVRAASLVLQRSGQAVGLDIELTKRIPVGAGLGGGSSDAAATIVGLNRLLDLGWSRDEMAALGQELGSDVPFFFFPPSAIVQGKGEEVRPIQLAGERWVLLVQPGFPVETKWAYEQLARTRLGPRPLSKALEAVATAGALSWNDVIPLMENDFEEVLRPTHGVFGEIKRHMLLQGAEAALLSGTGSTVFGLFNSERDANRARTPLQQAGTSWTGVARTSSS